MPILVSNKQAFRVSPHKSGLIFYTILLSVFLVLLARLIEMQVIQGAEYREKADQNRFFTRYIPASRGIFTDRNGKVLVMNKPLYKQATFETKGKPYPEFTEISTETALTLLAEEEKNIIVDQKRTYPFEEALSSVLGYIGNATKEELLAHSEYYLGESVGKTGLERVFQVQLGGRPGKEIYEMDAKGSLLRVFQKIQAFPGTTIQLTIDAEFSKKAYELLQGKKGAIIATDSKTGEVLVLVSSPFYNPSHIVSALTDENLPFLNRAITGTYPPGSTFKLMTALAGLSTQVITTETEVVDEGQIQVGEFTFGNWYYNQYGRTEGKVDIIKALSRSNDIFFYKTAEWVGPEHLAKMARTFHYGSPTGIEVPGESSGLIPDPIWKEKTIGEQWFLGNTYHMGIGQGDVLATPLQINQATAAIVNQGQWCKPRIVKDSIQECIQTHVLSENLDLVRKGMKAACATGGTGFPFFDEKPVPVLCKTGTAEFGVQDEKGRRNTHAIFTVATPAKDPQLVLTVLLEGTEEESFLEGSKDAAPIAKDLLTWWFGQEK